MTFELSETFTLIFVCMGHDHSSPRLKIKVIGQGLCLGLLCKDGNMIDLLLIIG